MQEEQHLNSHMKDQSEEPDHSGIPAALTDSGCEREFNEDRYAVIEGPSGLAWFVCDGMGGVPGGELAAQLAIDTIRRDLENRPCRPAEEAIRTAIQEANRVIVLRKQNELFSGMGTTLVGTMFQGNEMVLVHVGDSRAYLVKQTSIRQLTTDHTLVQELVDDGKISPEEALDHPNAHVLTKCLGAEAGLEISSSRYWISEEGDGDVLVLVTDGLYTLVGDQEILEHVVENSPQRACVKLVELAKARGGYDNITVSVIPLGGELRTTPSKGGGNFVISKEKPKAKSPALDSKVLVIACLALLIITAICALFLMA